MTENELAVIEAGASAHHVSVLAAEIRRLWTMLETQGVKTFFAAYQGRKQDGSSMHGYRIYTFPRPISALEAHDHILDQAIKMVGTDDVALIAFNPMD